MTQTEIIGAHLKTGQTIGPIQALVKYQCFRLAARIYDLRKDGWDIATIMHETEDGKKFAEYKLLKGAA